MICGMHEMEKCWLTMRSLANSPRTREGTIEVRYILLIAGLAKVLSEEGSESIQDIWNACSDAAHKILDGLPQKRPCPLDLQHWLNMAWVFQKSQDPEGLIMVELFEAVDDLIDSEV